MRPHEKRHVREWQDVAGYLWAWALCFRLRVCSSETPSTRHEKGRTQKLKLFLRAIFSWQKTNQDTGSNTHLYFLKGGLDLVLDDSAIAGDSGHVPNGDKVEGLQRVVARASENEFVVDFFGATFTSLLMTGIKCRCKRGRGRKNANVTRANIGVRITMRLRMRLKAIGPEYN